MASLLLIILFGITANAQQCIKPYQCATQTIKKSVECAGFYSCTEAKIAGRAKTISCSAESACDSARALTGKTSVTCTGFRSCYLSEDITSKAITCDASQSCKKAVTQYALIKSKGDTNCYGAEACEFGTIQSIGSTSCNGVQACYAATIQSGEDLNCNSFRGCASGRLVATNLYCSGRAACKKALIHTDKLYLYSYEAGLGALLYASVVQAYGFQALRSADVDSEGHATMTLNLRGYFAGDGAVMICRMGSECKLICSGNACFNSKFVCKLGAVCTIDPAECMLGGTFRYNDIDCPEFRAISTDEEEKEFELFMQQRQIERDDDDDEDYEEDEYEDLKGNDNVLNPLVKRCIGYKECEGKTLRHDMNICEAKESCYNSTITQTETGGEAQVNCFGEASCIYSNIYTEGRVLCHGESSCEEGSIYADKSVTCHGSGACRNIFGDNMITSQLTVSCEGTLACRNSHISSVMATKCSASKACLSAVISSAEDDVICDGDTSCYKATLYALKNVTCTGEKSCYSGNLEADNNIFADGYYAAAYSRVSAEFIRGVGHYSLCYTDINSATESGKIRPSMVVKLYGHMASFGSTIICQSGSKCRIVCRGTGCKGAEVVCMSGSDCLILPKDCIKNKNGLNPNYTVVQGAECPKVILATDIQMDADLEKYIKQKQLERIGEDDELQETELWLNVVENVVNNESESVSSIGWVSAMIIGIILTCMILMIGYFGYFKNYKNISHDGYTILY